MNSVSVKFGRIERLLRLPVFSDGFRVFFPLAAVSGLVLILYWGLALSGVWQMEMLVEPLLLHRYDMIFGFLVAAMAGFLTTAVPAWSDTAKVAGWELLGLGVLWVMGRVAFWLVETLPGWLVFGLHFAFLLALAIRVIPPLWKARMRHLVWPVALLISAQAISVIGYATGGWEVMSGLVLGFDAGLALAEGAFAIMVLTALAPISTVIVNKALEEREDGVKFVPRPPIRRVAMLCLMLYSLSRMLELSDALQGWLGLASACAVLNILQDWHLQKALSTSFAKALYLVYWFVALGLGLQASSLLGLLDAEAFVAGRHMLFIGGFTFATLMVLIIAGTRHSGRSLHMLPLFGLSILCLVAACLMRSVLPLVLPEIDWMLPAWTAFALCFAFYLAQILPWVFAEDANDD